MKFDTEIIVNFLTAASFKLIYCVVIFIACIVSIKISSKLIDGFFSPHLTSAKLIDPNKSATLKALSLSVAKYAIIFVGICSALIYLGVPSATLTAVLGTGTVAIGLGAQNVIKDIIAGFFIIFENQFSVGDIVTIDGKVGTVESITVRITQLRGFDGALHTIPNGSILTVSNLCKDFANATVDVNVSYEEDLERVLKILNDEMDNAVKEIKSLRARPTVLGVISLGESFITIRTIAECNIKENAMTERELRLRIKNRFDKENISIPFPQRTIHITEK